ncbi:heme NO-binding domain-containing protein [Acidiphilium sp. PA]|uniref:heme NO-binding domain-containing protein n=1 Tax=Acidiphilium sp. PA TaxID=2871705 RepID=UPI002244B6EB|nr:heme NO-binding domain-containing protein [Acidiphilium sp. PA]MCW8308274.1 heme NO-binding domain-containing protein [Acidiphilium sp. PA]
MIGLIPFLVDRFTTAHCGAEVRRTILAACDLPPDFEFGIAQTYDDDVCRTVITAMAARTGLSLPDLYDRLGHFFLAWLAENLGGLFTGAEDTASFLMRLPIVYNSLAGTARGSGLQGASEVVSVRQHGERLRITYQSQASFASFYASFMRAVASHFGQSIDVTILAGDLEGPFCVFDVAVAPPHPGPPAAHLSDRNDQPEVILCHGD